MKTDRCIVCHKKEGYCNWCSECGADVCDDCVIETRPNYFLCPSCAEKEKYEEPLTIWNVIQIVILLICFLGFAIAVMFCFLNPVSDVSGGFALFFFIAGGGNLCAMCPDMLGD